MKIHLPRTVIHSYIFHLLKLLLKPSFAHRSNCIMKIVIYPEIPQAELLKHISHPHFDSNNEATWAMTLNEVTRSIRCEGSQKSRKQPDDIEALIEELFGDLVQKEPTISLLT